MKLPPLYVIVDMTRTRSSDETIFWKPNSCGYTNHLGLAGLYNEKQANEICDGPFSDNIKILYAEAKKMIAEVIPKSSILNYVRESKNG